MAVNDLTKITDVKGRYLIFRNGDHQSRMILLNIAEQEYLDGNTEGCTLLFHAEIYLADRLLYTLFPPSLMKGECACH